jgi:Protein of unknown function (DUF3617)
MKLEVKWALIGPIVTVLMAGTARAAPPIKTGLWEEVTTVKRDPAPERTLTTRICLTPADLERVDQRAAQMGNNKNCKLENYKHGERSSSSDWFCAAKDVNMRGHGEVVYDDSTHFHVSTTQQTKIGGRVINTTLTSQSHWLSADCGNVKPLAEYPKK